MQSEPHGTLESQVEDIQYETKEDFVVCPNCKVKHDPNTIYCLNCGYPLYARERDESEQTKPGETEDISEVASELQAKLSSETEMEAGFSLQIEEAVEAQEERTCEEAEVEVESELSETSNLIDSVRARARDLARRYSPFRREPRASEIESEEKQVPGFIEEEYRLPVEDVEDLDRDQVTKEIAELSPGSEPDPILKGVMVNLVKSISLNLWLVNQLQEGNTDEEQFNKLFEDYVNRSELFMNCRNEMLERARDLDSIERALKEAKMGLSELEMKKTIGDISEDEYEAKAPGFKWDIDKREDKISKRKEEIAFLEDLSRVMSTEEIARMKEMAEKCQSAMDGLEESCNISSETVARVRASLEGTLACLEDFECL